MFYKLEAPGEYSPFAEEILFKILRRLQFSIKGNINIALSGGQTPIPILKLLKNRDLIWDQFSFFMVDERTVPIEDSSSNYGNIMRAFLKDINSFSYSMVQKDQSFKFSSQNYSKLIEKKIPMNTRTGFPKFDLVVLGMGEDGHTASLFPGTKALSEETEIAVLNEIPQLKTKRITLTYPVILSAAEIIVLAKGQSKKAIVNELYSGKSPDYPILNIVKNHTNVNWILD